MLLCEGWCAAASAAKEKCAVGSEKKRERFQSDVRLKALSQGLSSIQNRVGLTLLKIDLPLRRRVADAGAAFGILTSRPASNSELTPTPFILAISSAETL